MTNIADVRCVRPSAINRIWNFQKTASVAYDFGAMMQRKATATDANTPYMIAATSSTEALLGVLQIKITANDADYAKNTLEPLMIDEMGIWEFAVFSGTAAQANSVQSYHDLKDSTQIDVGATTVNNIFVTKFISATKVRGAITLWSSIQAGDVA